MIILFLFERLQFSSAWNPTLISRKRFVFNTICGYITPFMTDINDNIYKKDNGGEDEDEYVHDSNKIENKNSFIDDETLSVRYYGQIDNDSCYRIIESLLFLNTIAKRKENAQISLHIQSLGGELLPAFYLCDVIKNLETPIYTYVDGFCASAATLITVCGRKRFMTRHSSMLVHQLKSEVNGKLDEMKEEITNLDLFMRNVEDIYYSNTNMNKTILEEILVKDIWLDSEMCLKYGLVDEII
tara:strand:+ start:1772 stop:2497 length:726 start_codon:yes stop_codon:yes gene_type:complete